MSRVEAIVTLAAGFSDTEIGELRTRLDHLAAPAERTPTTVVPALADTVLPHDPAYDFIYRPATA